MQRTKTLSFKLVVLLLITCLIIPLLPDVTARATDFEERFYDFEDGTSTGWYRPWNGELSVSSEKAYAGSKSLKITGRQNSWDSPALNMYNIIKQGGAGVYTIHMAVLVDNLVDGGEYGHLLIRGNQENSFITLRSNGNYYYKLTSTVKLVENEWYYFTGSFIVTNDDISATSGLFNLCFDFITPTENQNIYIDNVRIIQSAAHTEALTVIPTETTLCVGARLVLDVNRVGNLTFTSSNPDIATVDANGVVFAISSGITTITINYNNTETAECVVNVKGVEDGTYFVKNAALNNYMQLNDNGAVTLETWEFDGAQDQRWNFVYAGEGYYKITCASGGKALTVPLNVANITLRVMDFENKDTQLWMVNKFSNGSYKITPKSAADNSNDWCMAVGDSLTENNTDGRSVEYRKYNNLNNQEKGQWVLRPTKTFYVYHYYDEGFLKRTNNSLELIKECQNQVSSILYDLYGVTIVAKYFSYTSKADDCKRSLFNEVSAETVNYECTHSPSCLQSNEIRSELTNDVGEGEIFLSKVLWTGHIMSDHKNDRSNSNYNMHIVIINSANTVLVNKEQNIFRDNSYSDKRIENTFTLMHELSHQLTLPDHYCYNNGGDGEKCSNPYCDYCNKEEVHECMMQYRYNLFTQNPNTLYCDDCDNTMKEYLDTYF